MALAPVVLFVYNRPWHARHTLEALAKNVLADRSELFVFADGPKENANENDRRKIIEVRKIIKEKQWCKSVYFFESDVNKGLSNSVISGVNKIFVDYDKIIALEDDIVTSCYFLKYMNDALDLYENEDMVGGITGHSFVKDSSETYFSTLSSCWSWATWKRIWDMVIFDSGHWLEKIKNKEDVFTFNYFGTYDFYSILKKQHERKVDSWDILFKASLFCNNKLFLFPGKSIVENIGFDSGTHYAKGPRVKKPGKKLFKRKIVVKQIPIMESAQSRIKLMKALKLVCFPEPPTLQKLQLKIKKIIRIAFKSLFYDKKNI